jgi:hypothetical protein
MQHIVMLLSHSGEYPCEYKYLKFSTNTPKIIWLTWRNTEKMRHYTWLRMLANVIRMPLRILRMPLRCLRCLRCLHTPYEWNDYTTHAWRIAYKRLDNVTKHGRVSQVTWTCSDNMVTGAPRNCKFSINMVNSLCCSHTVANGLTNVLRSLQMPCHHFKCLAIQMPCHQYEWLTIAYENVAKTMRICYSPGTCS